jgi:hypothetical protein
MMYRCLSSKQLSSNRTVEMTERSRGKGVLGINPGLNTAKQLIDVSGPHAWIAPGNGDLRGPYPGLNVMSNQYVLFEYVFHC